MSDVLIKDSTGKWVSLYGNHIPNDGHGAREVAVKTASGMKVISGSRNPTGATRFIKNSAGTWNALDKIDGLPLTFIVNDLNPGDVFTISTRNVGFYDAIVDWGDGTKDHILTFDDPKLSHTYVNPVAGVKLRVTISGTFPSFYFADALSQSKIRRLATWGDTGLLTLQEGFKGCSLLERTNSNAGDPILTNVTNMASLFEGCTEVTIVDVGNWDMSGVTDISNMFKDDGKLAALDVSVWDTGNITNMEGTFYNTLLLRTLDVSNWNVGNVINMTNTFNNSRVALLDVTNWDVSKVELFVGTFRKNPDLATLDVSNWNTVSAITVQALFNNLPALTVLDVSGFKLGKVTTIKGMFYGSNLAVIDVANWDVSQVTSMENVFNNCLNISTLAVENWDTGNVTTMSAMFATSGTTGLTNTKLTVCDVSNWDTSKITDINVMLTGRAGLTSLSIKGWDIGEITTAGGLISRVKLSTAEYNATLVAWEGQPHQKNVSVNFGSSKYTAGSAAEQARTDLVNNDSWVIVDAGSTP